MFYFAANGYAKEVQHDQLLEPCIQNNCIFRPYNFLYATYTQLELQHKFAVKIVFIIIFL